MRGHLGEQREALDNPAGSEDRLAVRMEKGWGVWRGGAGGCWWWWWDREKVVLSAHSSAATSCYFLLLPVA